MSDEATEARLARKERRHARKRRRILEAAAKELFAAGLDGFRIADVAERADLSKPAVYYYFSSREALLAALLVDRFKAETLKILAAVQRAESGVDALVGMLRAYVRHYEGDLLSYRVLQIWMLSAGSQTELLEREVYPLSWQVMSAVEEKLRRDQTEGRVHAEVTPRLLANIALMQGHGIISTFAGMDALGGELRFSVDAMLDEAESMLRRATQVPERPA